MIKGEDCVVESDFCIDYCIAVFFKLLYSWERDNVYGLLFFLNLYWFLWILFFFSQFFGTVPIIYVTIQYWSRYVFLFFCIFDGFGIKIRFVIFHVWRNLNISNLFKTFLNNYVKDVFLYLNSGGNVSGPSPSFAFILA